jgi:hypothetical protein
MLFRAFPVDDACLPIDGNATDIYAVLLDKSTGKAVSRAFALADLNISSGESTETDPSFAPDLCSIYFASDGGTAGGYEFDIYRAFRR